MIHSHLQRRRHTLCECGCGELGDRLQMKSVRMTAGAPRRVGHTLFRQAKSWRVRPQCVEDFKRELKATDRCRATCELLNALPRWARLWRLPALWQLRRASLARRMGHVEAKRRAWALVWSVLRVPRS